MVRRFFILLSVFWAVSSCCCFMPTRKIFIGTICGIRSRTLKNGYKKVPYDKEFFNKHYRKRYGVVNLKDVDYNAVYIEAYIISAVGDWFNSRQNNNTGISIIKFYNNGCVNKFYIDKNRIDNLPLLNPEIRGYRGILYKKNKDILMDIVANITGCYILCKYKYKVRIKGDTLFLKSKENSNKDTYVYLRKVLSEKNLNYEADW